MATTGKAEPRFDLDYSYGRQGELQIGEFLNWIASGNGQVEVKRKRYLDLKFYVETHCDKGLTGTFAKSGILVTTAKAWAFVIGDTGISLIMPTDELRAFLDDPSTCGVEESDGKCPTRGRLIDLVALLWRLKQNKEGIARQPYIQPDKVEHRPALRSEAGQQLGKPCQICGEPGCIAPHEDEIHW